LFRVSPRLGDCGSRPVGDRVQVKTTAAGRAYMAGLASCGLVHQCPWCGPKIRHGRTVEILECFAAVKAMGGAAHLLTLTLPHDLPDSLGKLLAALDAGWKRIPAGGTWTRLGARIGYLGYYYAEEILCSCEAGGTGWHPHLHVLIFTDHWLEADEWAALTVYARQQWQAGVVSQGVRRPHDVHGVDLAPNVTDDAVARYVTKVQEGGEPSGWTPAHELARGDVKDGRAGSLVPFMLAATFLETGDLEYLARWRQYVAATKGRPAIRSSRGLRKRLGLAAAATDAVLAAAEVEDSSHVADLPCAVWARVLSARVETDLLDAAEAGGLAAVNDLLAAFGCGWANAPPRRE
jgi:hypothetical protein